jgi:hypothetical protein
MHALPSGAYGPLGTALALHGPYKVPMHQVMPVLTAYAEDEHIELFTFPYIREGQLVHAVVIQVADPEQPYDLDAIVTIEFGPTENEPAPFGDETDWQQLWLIVRRPLPESSGAQDAVRRDSTLEELADLPRGYAERVLGVLNELAELLQQKLPHAATIIQEAKRQRQRDSDLADIYSGKTR